MKTQQRKFVIEIKTKRRMIGREKSIWGDTDLKALARAVEDEAEKAFGPPVLEANDHPPERGLQPIAEASPTPANDSIVDSSGAARPGEVCQPTLGAVNEAPKPEITRKVYEIRSRRRRRSAKSVERSRPAVSENELSGLVAENERLKRLFKDQLHRENELLRRLLARFA